MIVIKMEMWPRGDSTKAVEFGRAYIINNVTTSSETRGELGTYDISLQGGIYGREDLLSKPPWKRAKISNFNRVKEGGWHLLLKGLGECLRK